MKMLVQVHLQILRNFKRLMCKKENKIADIQYQLQKTAEFICCIQTKKKIEWRWNQKVW